MPMSRGRWRWWCLGVVAVAFLMSASALANDSQTIDPDRGATKLARSINGFGFDLWKRLRAEGHDGNAVLSPVSLGLGLSMAYIGARADTATAFEHVLHINSARDATASHAAELMNLSTNATGGAVTIANRLYVHTAYRLDAKYVALTRDAFGAATQQVDFKRRREQTARAINRWVSDTTHGRIPTVVDAASFTKDTRLVLINAIHFKAEWTQPFTQHDTRDQRFFVNGGPTEFPVPMMNGAGERYGRHERTQLLELSYRGGDLVMLFALPDARDGLPVLEARLDRELFDTWVNALARTDVSVTLPRFKIATAAIDLNGPLTALGLGLAFSANADFGGISATPGSRFAISRVLHRAFVEVNERGTEAAAATAIAMDNLIGGVLPPSTRFVADHPFLFFIRDRRTGAILFAGRVVDPRGSQ